jgi:galactokinase
MFKDKTNLKGSTLTMRIAASALGRKDRMELVVVYHESTKYTQMKWAENRAMEWVVVPTNCV